MRKKSHISLARYIVNSLDDKELKKHRFSFYIGSVLPDIKPSFIYKRHEINGTCVFLTLCHPDCLRYILQAKYEIFFSF